MTPGAKAAKTPNSVQYLTLIKKLISNHAQIITKMMKDILFDSSAEYMTRESSPTSLFSTVALAMGNKATKLAKIQVKAKTRSK